MTIRVSAVIKARNESAQIADAVTSAALLADEVLVIDDGSSDATAEIAERAGARVVKHRSEAGRITELDRFGIEQASGSWILRLDADERLTPELAARLRAVMEEGRHSGVAFARRNMMFGDWPRHGGWFVSDQIRLFQKSDYDATWTAELHSQIPLTGPVLRLARTPELSTLHLDYADVGDFVDRTLGRYSLTEARELYKKGRRFSGTRLVTAPCKRFAGRYVVRRGFRDGRRGLILAALLAAYDIAIECHLWDIERQERNGAHPTTDRSNTDESGGA
jgi:glycosyltransferase involved in cell wall biosynthesis